MATDRCGVCGGDGTSCQGCLDVRACNYDYQALVAGGDKCTFPKPNHWCNGVCIGLKDCRGECLGSAKRDICDVCEGDGSSCHGCRDPDACNYQFDAKFGPRSPEEDRDKLCIYKHKLPNHDCYGTCLAGYFDCLGVCGGTASKDRCGVCNGKGDTCTGCTNSLACNYDKSAVVDSGTCKLPPDPKYDCAGFCVAEVAVAISGPGGTCTKRSAGHPLLVVKTASDCLAQAIKLSASEMGGRMLAQLPDAPSACFCICFLAICFHAVGHCLCLCKGCINE